MSDTNYSFATTEITTEDWQMISELVFALNEDHSPDSLKEQFLQKLHDLIPYDRALFDFGQKTGTTILFFSPTAVNIEDAYLDLYYDKLQYADPLGAFFLQVDEPVYRDSEYVTPARTSSSAFYQNWLKPQNIAYGIGASISYQDVFYGSVNLWNTSESADFTQRDLQILRVLHEHLSQRLHRMFPNGIQKDYSKVAHDPIARKYNLTPREMEIIYLLRDGCDTKAIAEKLYISEHTVKRHFANIFKKTGVSRRVQLLHLFAKKE